MSVIEVPDLSKKTPDHGLTPSITTADYLRAEIQRRIDENVGFEVEKRLAMRMAIGNSSPQKFEQVQAQFVARIKANNVVIEIYTDYLKEELAKNPEKQENKSAD